MNDSSKASGADFTPEPIQVNATPMTPQIEAGIRQAALAVGTILSTLGFTALADKAGLAATLAPQIAMLVVVIGPLVTGVAAWLGQLATRRRAQEAITMATKLADKDAVLK